MPETPTAFEPGWLELDDAGKAQWEEFVESATGSVPYARLPFAEAFRDEIGIPFRVAVARDRKGVIRTGALLYERRRGPYRECVVPLMVQYVPVLARPFPSEADIHLQSTSIDALLSFLEDSYHVCRVSLPPEMVDVRTFKWRHWEIRPFYTYRIHLPENENPSAWSSSALRLFKKESAEYVLEEEAQGIESLVSLNTLTYGRQNREFPYDENRLVRFLRAIGSSGLLHVFTVRRPREKVPEGAVALLHGGSTAYYWLAASRPGPAMTVLIGHLMPELSRRGFSVFDFVGANTPSIAEFKRRFGPELTPYYHAERYVRPELRLAHAFRSLF